MTFRGTTGSGVGVPAGRTDADTEEPSLELDGVRRVLPAPVDANGHSRPLEDTTDSWAIRADTPIPGLTEARVSLRRWTAALIALDLLMAMVASGFGFAVRFGSNQSTELLRGVPYWLIAVALVPVWVIALAAGGAYDRRFFAIGPEEFRRIINAGVWLMAFVAFAVFVLHVGLSRAYVGITFPLLVVLTLLERYAVRKALHRRLAKGHAIYRTVIVGPRASAEALRTHMDRTPWAGFSVVGVHDPEAEHSNADQVVDAVRRAGGDTIAVAAAWDSTSSSGTLRALSWRLEGTGIRLVVAPAVTDIAGPRIVVRQVEGLPLLMIEDPQMHGGSRLLKQVLDRAVALVALLVLSPVLAVLAGLVKLSSRGPVLYRQERVGVHGERFQIWKFRTMRVGAEHEQSNLGHLNHTNGVLFKIRKDPRVTPTGRWIRRHSLDELPQFWNVLRGQMSLVGPRPPLPCEVEQYGDDARRRLLVKPGMTGLWQISGRAELPWEESVRLDLFYVENWSVMMDLMVLWKTLAAVLHGRGAY
jgi:exopolysaccharide biosynthesis polyprenyl glycosylphosphotransferase